MWKFYELLKLRSFKYHFMCIFQNIFSERIKFKQNHLKIKVDSHCRRKQNSYKKSNGIEREFYEIIENAKHFSLDIWRESIKSSFLWMNESEQSEPIFTVFSLFTNRLVWEFFMTQTLAMMTTFTIEHFIVNEVSTYACENLSQNVKYQTA